MNGPLLAVLLGLAASGVLGLWIALCRGYLPVLREQLCAICSRPGISRTERPVSLGPRFGGGGATGKVRHPKH